MESGRSLGSSAALITAAVTSAMVFAGSGCGGGSRCAEVAQVRDALKARTGAPDRGADLRVSLPLHRVNELIAGALAEQALAVELPFPDLGPLRLFTSFISLSVVVKQVQVFPGPHDLLRMAVQLELRDGVAAEKPQELPGVPSQEQLAETGKLLLELSLVADVRPGLERGIIVESSLNEEAAAAGLEELGVRFSLDDVRDVKPSLPPGAQEALVGALKRWLPRKVRDLQPDAFYSSLAKRFGEHLVNATYHRLHQGLLARLGELTSVHLALPQLPIAEAVLRTVEWAAATPASPSSAGASPTTPAASLIVELRTTLPVRRGLAPLRPSDPASARALAGDFAIQLSPSATAELANWSIARGLAPRWYTRGLSPSPTGEFRPRFDHLAEDPAHPFQIYAFQERGGCSYFRVGVRGALAMDGSKLQATALDRSFEAASASPLLEVAAWVKYALFGSVDQSRRLAAATRLSIGARAFDAAVTGASLAPDELRFSLQLTAATDRASSPRGPSDGAPPPRR